MNNKDLFIAQAAIREEMQIVDKKLEEINDFIMQRLMHAAEIARNIKYKRFYHEKYPHALQWVPVLTRSRGKITIETTTDEMYPIQITHTRTSADVFFPRSGADTKPEVETHNIHKSFLTGDTWGMAAVIRKLFYAQREDDLKKFRETNNNSLKDLRNTVSRAKEEYDRAERVYAKAERVGSEEIRLRSTQISNYQAKRKNRQQTGK